MKTRLMGAKLYHADRQKDMTKVTDAFRNLAKAPETCKRNLKHVPFYARNISLQNTTFPGSDVFAVGNDR